jgi:hypothetical protein
MWHEKFNEVVELIRKDKTVDLYLQVSQPANDSFYCQSKNDYLIDDTIINNIQCMGSAYKDCQIFLCNYNENYGGRIYSRNLVKDKIRISNGILHKYDRYIPENHIQLMYSDMEKTFTLAHEYGHHLSSKNTFNLLYDNFNVSIYKDEKDRLIDDRKFILNEEVNAWNLGALFLFRNNILDASSYPAFEAIAKANLLIYKTSVITSKMNLSLR